MPWHVAESKLCPASKPWAVIKNADRKIVGCHETHESANKQLAALYANEPGGNRMSDEMSARPVERGFLLDDVHVRSDGDGRTVEAYAAMFDTRAEIQDQDGHYNEVLAPTSFNRTIHAKGPGGFRVLFNHGRTIDGTPNPMATTPIGTPIEVRADERGVFTATRYINNPLADDVLDAIKAGAIKAQSFSGRFLKSARTWPDGRRQGALSLITRNEIDMREYGPAVFAAYEAAAILGTRSERFIRELLDTPPDRRLAWLEQFEGLTTLAGMPDPEALPVGTPNGPADRADDSREHSARPMTLRTRIRVARIVRGME
jgi:HK97 family phage prohead protease